MAIDVNFVRGVFAGSLGTPAAKGAAWASNTALDFIIWPPPPPPYGPNLDSEEDVIAYIAGNCNNPALPGYTGG